MDDGFAYAVPDDLEVGVGSIVRVPLGGRRVRGWVTSTGEPSRAGLRELLGVSGDHRVFDRELLDVVRWAAIHYVAPLAVLIAKTSPPNLPRGGSSRLPRLPDGGFPPSDAPQLTATVAAGRRQGTLVWMRSSGWAEGIAGMAGPAVAAGRSLLVVGATAVEVEELATALRRWFGGRVGVASPERSAAQRTTAWVAAQRPGTILVGTREVAFWPMQGIGMAVVVGDGRRGLKDKATPTTHARDVLWRRSGVERFSLVVGGPVPTTEALGRGAQVITTRPRPWGLVEVVDRTEDPPGGGVLARRTRAALHAVVGGGGRAFVFTDRRSPAMRCVRCRTLRSCPTCGARPDRGPVCPRCGTDVGPCRECGGERFEPLGAPLERVRAEAAGMLGREHVGEVGTGAAVTVGTERDLPGLEPVDLAIVVDADGLVRAPHYRAVEDGMRIMARVVAAAGAGRGRRGIVQTADPGHPVLAALRRGDPLPLLQSEIEGRVALGFPPSGELLVIEARHAPEGADGGLRSAIGDRAAVLGPAAVDGRHRWLVQGEDLQPARLALRGLVQDWRDLGAGVRIDADPIDL